MSQTKFIQIERGIEQDLNADFELGPSKILFFRLTFLENQNAEVLEKTFKSNWKVDRGCLVSICQV